MPLKVLIAQESKGVFIISPIGSIDSQTYAELDKSAATLLVPSTKVIMLDMKDVSYISSMGVSTVLKIKKGLEQNDGRLVMANLQPQIKKVFDIIKALPSENILRSINELDDYLNSIQRQALKKPESA